MPSILQSKKVLIAGLLTALLGTIPACVTTSDFDRLRSQVYYQEQERVKLQERITQLEADQARSQPVQANSWAELNSMRSQLASLTGQLEDMRRTQEMQQAGEGGVVTIDSLSAQVRDLERKNLFMASQLGIVFEEMPQAPAGQPAQPGPNATQPQLSPASPQAPTEQLQIPVPQPQAPAMQPQAPAEQPQTPAAEQFQSEGPGGDLYQKALENFYAKKYQQAQVMWAEFVKGFPKDPLVPNAVFWQGESFFQMQDYANAVLTYQKVIEKHSTSNKYKAALLKQGISFYKLKKDQAGKLVLDDLIKKYPDSAEAKRAQAYLKSGN
jgi:tol-pal system protein YbgF